ncbi:hypothetical protein ES703_74441 [subsurface metagenome]
MSPHSRLASSRSRPASYHSWLASPRSQPASSHSYPASYHNYPEVPLGLPSGHQFHPVRYRACSVMRHIPPVTLQERKRADKTVKPIISIHLKLLSWSSSPLCFHWPTSANVSRLPPPPTAGTVQQHNPTTRHPDHPYQSHKPFPEPRHSYYPG